MRRVSRAPSGVRPSRRASASDTARLAQPRWRCADGVGLAAAQLLGREHLAPPHGDELRRPAPRTRARTGHPGRRARPARHRPATGTAACWASSPESRPQRATPARRARSARHCATNLRCVVPSSLRNASWVEAPALTFAVEPDEAVRAVLLGHEAAGQPGLLVGRAEAVGRRVEVRARRQPREAVPPCGSGRGSDRRRGSTGTPASSRATKSAKPSSSQVGIEVKVAPVATWVASWLITTCAPRSLSLSKTVGFTNTRTGASGGQGPVHGGRHGRDVVVLPRLGLQGGVELAARVRDLHEQGSAPVREHAPHLAYGGSQTSPA